MKMRPFQQQQQQNRSTYLKVVIKQRLKKELHRVYDPNFSCTSEDYLLQILENIKLIFT